MATAPHDRDDTANDATDDSDSEAQPADSEAGRAAPVMPPDAQGRWYEEAPRRECEETAAELLARLRGGGRESAAHRWGKLTLYYRRRQRRAPWFRGVCEFERTVSDWVADCLVTTPSPHRTGDGLAWIEFVKNAEQSFRAKTRAALRFGYPIYWVIHADEPGKRRAARTALASDETVDADISFGAFNPKTNTLELGTPITFDQYRIPVESLDAFRSEDVLGYRDGAAHIPRIRDNWWRDFGWMRIDGDPYRVAVRTNDELVRLRPPTGPFGTTREIDLDDESSWLAQRIAAGNVERVGPIPPTSTYERRSYANLPPRRE